MASALIVDDKLIMRRKLKGVLRKIGLDIAGEAENGIQAIKKCKEASPDLVLLDIIMPKMDGIETLKKLKNEFPEMSIVMVSSLSQKKKVLKAIKLGADHYIVKPIEEEDIREVLIETLGEDVIDE